MKKAPAFDPMMEIKEERIVDNEIDQTEFTMAYSLTIKARINNQMANQHPELAEIQKRRMRAVLEQGFVDSFVGYLSSRGQVINNQRVFMIREDIPEDIVITSGKRYPTFFMTPEVVLTAEEEDQLRKLSKEAAEGRML